MLSRRKFLYNTGLLLAAVRASGGSDPIFERIAAGQSGISWVHDNGKSAMHWLPESMCSGCAFFDFDNDGWMDLFLVNTGPSDFYQPKQPTRCALYKNNRDGTFTDVTVKAGLEGGVWGGGVAIGDYDNDGWPDVFVCSFVEYSAQSKVFCGNNKLGVRYYCVPRIFGSTVSNLFHNNGDGTFTEVGHLSAIGKTPAKAHGVVATDINNDGLTDLFVANDTLPNSLFVNRGGGKFEEIAFTAGVAYGDTGNARSGMGVDSGDYDNDGRMDLFVSNIDREQFSLYHNDGDETFSDRAAATGIGRATANLSGWGLKFFDYDNDGNLDLILANGHPDDMIEQYTANVTWSEPLLLFHGDGKTLTNVSDQAGPEFAMHWPARGLAVGDYDNDGGIDVLINNSGAAPLLLHNRHGKRNNWIGLKLVGRNCNTDAVGARITWCAGGVTRSRLKTTGGSYLSSHDGRMVCGIGPSKRIDWLEVKWPLPSGKVERFTSLPLNRYVTLLEGKGIQE